jgi:hypothetical protein
MGLHALALLGLGVHCRVVGHWRHSCRRIHGRGIRCKAGAKLDVARPSLPPGRTIRDARLRPSKQASAPAKQASAQVPWQGIPALQEKGGSRITLHSHRRDTHYQSCLRQAAGRPRGRIPELEFYFWLRYCWGYVTSRSGGPPPGNP